MKGGNNENILSIEDVAIDIPTLYDLPDGYDRGENW